MTLLAGGSIAAVALAHGGAATRAASDKSISVGNATRARRKLRVRGHHQVAQGHGGNRHSKKDSKGDEGGETQTGGSTGSGGGTTTGGSTGTGTTPKPPTTKPPTTTNPPVTTPTTPPSAPTPPPVSTPPAAPCDATVSSVSAAQSAVNSAANGDVVCLADGSYGKVSLNSKKSGQGVTLRSLNPAGATIAGASLAGSDLRLADFVSTGEIEVQPGASGMTIEHNRITGGGEGIDAGPTSTTSINDLAIIGNQLIGPFGEDAIHLNRYHDADGDGVGILIEGNEITGVRENGNHSDCLQTVWTGDHIVFRRNYVHNNRCQGFFIKDQDSLPASSGVVGPIQGISVEDNLFIKNTEPCAASAAGCGQPNVFQVFGPYSGFRMTHNTIWGDGESSIAAFRESTGSDTVIANNVIYKLWTDTNMSGVTLSENTVCKRETGPGGSWPSSRPGETVNCGLAFANTAANNFQLSSGTSRGIDWAPAAQHYGP